MNAHTKYRYLTGQEHSTPKAMNILSTLIEAVGRKYPGLLRFVSPLLYIILPLICQVLQMHSF